MEEFNENLNENGRRLVYAYIPYYRCLYNVNLNFDQHFNFEYNPSQKILSIRKIDYIPKDFWPDGISSVSVIAGKNGAGKSSALRWLLEMTLPYKKDTLLSSLENGIIVIAEGDNLTIYHGIIGLETEPHVIDGKKTNCINVLNGLQNRLMYRLAFTPIYYSGHFDSNIGSPYSEDDGKLIWNISDQFLLMKDSDDFLQRYLGKNNVRQVEYLRYYHFRNDLRICRLLADRRFQDTFVKNNHPSLRLPRFIVFIVNASDQPLLERRIKDLSNSITVQDGLLKTPTKNLKSTRRLLEKISKVEVNPVMYRIAKKDGKEGFEKYLYYAIQSFCFDIICDNSAEQGLKDTVTNLFVTDYAKSGESVTDWTHKAKSIFMERASKLKTPLSDGSKIFVNSYFESLEKAMDFLNRLHWKYGKAYIDCVSHVKDPDFIHPPGAQIYADSFPQIIRQLHDSIENVEQFTFITYSHTLYNPTTLSSGELAMLNLYSRIKYAFDKLSPDENKKKSVILLLDEAEIGFHPEWQRQFVNKLTQFVSLMNQRRCPIQIIYTTHSPITLSDMPKESVNLLKTYKIGATTVSFENKKESFGANVFELYGDSFFMENGIIGELASEKIKDINEEIEELIRAHMDKSEANLADVNHDMQYVNNLRLRIDMIGDKRIRAYLSSRLKEIESNDEISRLRRRIAELEAERESSHEEN